MKLHEYQAKDLLARHGVPVLPGRVIDRAEDAGPAFDEWKGPLMVKAQVHAGGRGKAGGIQMAKTRDEALSHARAILGMRLVSAQTGPEGRIVHKVLLTPARDVAKEFYVGVVMDRRRGCPVVMASAEGGMDIEEVARAHPEKIRFEPIDPVAGPQPWQARSVARFLGFTGVALPKAAAAVLGVMKAYFAVDASLAEINPLVSTTTGEVLALDAKVDLDDNALFRHKDLADLRDWEEEDPVEREAIRHELSYIHLAGNIGCMVNGAGLAMATMDIIKLHGGEPANFLDVGGGATAEKVTAAFKIILSDDRVKAILVNIFGGIMKCDVIAQGVIDAVKQIAIKVPLVVRLEGTRVKEGKERLAGSGLALLAATTMDEAARKVVEAAGS